MASTFFSRLSNLKAYENLSSQFIGGQWRAGTSERVTRDKNPFTDELLVEVQNASREDLDTAYQEL